MLTPLNQGRADSVYGMVLRSGIGDPGGGWKVITRAQHGNKITSSGLAGIKGDGEEEEVGRQANGDQEEGKGRG